MAQETERSIPTRRTVLKQLGVGILGSTGVAASTAAADTPSQRMETILRQGELVFSDGFEDGQLAWTDVDHPEFWTEQNGVVNYSPTSSAGSTGDNWLYANATFNGSQGLLEWPVAIEVRGYGSDTSAGVGAFAAAGGPRDGVTARLGVQDSPYRNQFTAWNSQNQNFTLSPARNNNTWYTYRLVPDLENDVVRVSRNGQEWTIPEPADSAIGNTSVVLSGGTCWGCGGNGDRKYEYIKVWNIPTAIRVSLDIKPGSDPNAINPASQGVIPVAVLKTGDFDPQRVNVSSLRFGAPDVVDGGGGARPTQASFEDVDGDGDADLSLKFPTQDTGFDGDETRGKLVGQTQDGTRLVGTDSVKIARQ